MGEYYFEVVAPKTEEVKAFDLLEGSNLIGRWDPDDGSFPEIDLEEWDPDCKISRKHAVIEIEDGQVVVEDLGSLNGTTVNDGNRLSPSEKAVIEVGDRLSVAATVLVLKKR